MGFHLLLDGIHGTLHTASATYKDTPCGLDYIARDDWWKWGTSTEFMTDPHPWVVCTVCDDAFDGALTKLYEGELSGPSLVTFWDEHPSETTVEELTIIRPARAARVPYKGAEYRVIEALIDDDSGHVELRMVWEGAAFDDKRRWLILDRNLKDTIEVIWGRDERAREGWSIVSR